MASLLKKKLKGFTLVEILVTVTIIAILASIAVIATNQARLKSRDIKRISNAREIVNALEAYYARNQSYPTMIFRGQPIESNGKEYLKEVPSNPFPRTDGGCADSDYTYTTTTTGYKFTFCIGSDNSRFEKGIVICRNGNCGFKEDCSGVITDPRDGIKYPIVRIGEQCWMAAHLKTKRRPDGNCVNLTGSIGPYVTDTTNCLTTYTAYPGKKFGGYGCWPSNCLPGSRRECIKSFGPIVPLSTDSTGWSNRGYDDIDTNYDYPPSAYVPGTTSDCNFHGALYTWPGALNLDNGCVSFACASEISNPHRGICPIGWHIPTDQEFHTLEVELTTSPSPCDANRNSISPGTDSCRDAGTKLITGGTSGFNSILLGARQEASGTDFFGIDTTAYFWTTTEGATNMYGLTDKAIARSLVLGVSGVYRSEVPKEVAAAVRCIRDF